MKSMFLKHGCTFSERSGVSLCFFSLLLPWYPFIDGIGLFATARALESINLSGLLLYSLWYVKLVPGLLILLVGCVA